MTPLIKSGGTSRARATASTIGCTRDDALAFTRERGSQLGHVELGHIVGRRERATRARGARREGDRGAITLPFVDRVVERAAGVAGPLHGRRARGATRRECAHDCDEHRVATDRQSSRAHPLILLIVHERARARAVDIARSARKARCSSAAVDACKWHKVRQRAHRKTRPPPLRRVLASTLFSMSDHGRQSKRHPSNHPLLVECESWAEFAQLYATDVSQGGMFIATDELPPILSEIGIKIRLPEGHEIALRANVVHVLSIEQAARERRPPGVGVQFIDLDPVRRQQIYQLVEFARWEGTSGQSSGSYASQCSRCPRRCRRRRCWRRCPRSDRGVATTPETPPPRSGRCAARSGPRRPASRARRARRASPASDGAEPAEAGAAAVDAPQTF